MKTKLQSVLLLTFFALLTFTSCQNEITEITQPDSEQVIAPNSPLASLMSATSTNDGTMDNIMDDANCMSINLPVTIIVNSITITINTLEDLQLIEDIFEEFNDDVDELEFLFPITIILNDYTEVVIEDQGELQEFIERCSSDDDHIECVDFKYPISFSIFNTDFQVIDTVVIEDDEALHDFLDRIEDAETAILASLNFPITMVYANGETVEVHNNQELERVINDAELMCDDDDDCDIDLVDEYLMDCHWNIHYYNEDDNFRPYDIFFMANGDLKILNESATIEITGHWNTSVTDAGIVLSISELTGFSEDLEGDWLIVECEDDKYKLVRQNAAGADNTRIVIKQHCDDEPNCGPQEIRMNLQECNWYAVTNLFDNEIGVFHFGADGVVVVVNLATNEEIIGTWEVALTDYGIKIILDLPEPYNQLSRYWKVIECSDHRIKAINEDFYIVFERECDNNPFECFGNTELVICDDDVVNGFAQFNLEMVYPNCPQDNVEITYHTTINDAEIGSNALETIYENNTNPQTIYARVVLAGSNDYEVFEVVLYVEDCTPGCTEEDVDLYLTTNSASLNDNCHWKPTTINNSNDFNTFDFYFNENLNLVIVDSNGAETVGTWMTTQGADGVIVSISQISGTLQQFNGEWLVVECNIERLLLSYNDVQLEFELECQ